MNDSAISSTLHPAISPSSLEHLRLLEEGVMLFNTRPMDGVRFLINSSVLADSPLEIAKFLATNPNLDKQRIGQFLAKDGQLTLAVLDAYAQIFDYVESPYLDEALRLFLSGFVLTGESQGIYRILERFAFYYSTSCEIVTV